jgi:hypothetical protein
MVCGRGSLKRSSWTLSAVLGLGPPLGSGRGLLGFGCLLLLAGGLNFFGHELRSVLALGLPMWASDSSEGVCPVQTLDSL